MMDKKLPDQVTEMRCKSDCIMSINLVVALEILNMESVYASQIGLVDGINRHFWEDMYGIIHSVLLNEKLFIQGDFNGHGRTEADRTKHGGFNYKDESNGGVSILDFVVTYKMMVENSHFRKKEDHLVISKSGTMNTRIDYFLMKVNNRKLSKDCKDFD